MDIPYTVENRQDTGLYNAKLGIWLFLASEVMLFGALFSAYILLRVSQPEGTWPHGWLNIPLGTLNTIVLITSSVTMVMALRIASADSGLLMFSSSAAIALTSLSLGWLPSRANSGT